MGLLMQQTENSAELFLYGSIGWPADFTDERSFDDVDAIKKLSALPAGLPLTVYVNSPGGSVTDAMAIKTQLEMRAKSSPVTICVTGLAASAASVIVCAQGARVVMGKGALLMLHNPMTSAFDANQHELRKTADTLERFAAQMKAVYMAKSHLSDAQVTQLMDDETWLSAEQSVELGFADAVDDSMPVTAALTADFLSIGGMNFDRRAFGSLPIFHKEKTMKETTKTQAVQPAVAGEAAAHGQSATPAPIASAEELTAKYPQLAEQIYNAGVKAERARLQALDELQGLGADDILAAAKYVDGLTVEQCSVKILKRQREQQTAAAQALKQDGAQAAAELAQLAPSAPTAAAEPGNPSDPITAMIINAMRKQQGGNHGND